MEYVLGIVSDECCEALQMICLPEDWTLLDHRKPTRFWALKRYLRNTFERLSLEDRNLNDRGAYQNKRIKVDEARRHAIMNTGIVDRRYEWIHALMDVAWDPETPRFSMKGFFLADGGDSSAFKEAARAFPELKTGDKASFLPHKARYAPAAKTVFNGWSPFQYRKPDERYDHIIGERLYRFPREYLNQVVGNRDKWALLARALDQAAAADHNGSADEAIELMTSAVLPLIREGGEYSIENRITHDLDAEIRRSVRRARYNQNIALPGYYPKHRVIQFYLPLCMASENVCDLVLVVSVEYHEHGNLSYKPRTVLGIDDTFADTRLVLPPQENWLPELARKMRSGHDERYGGDVVATPPLRSLRDSLATARLVNSKDARDTHFVKPGDCIGVHRIEDYRSDIELDKNAYPLMHGRHGRFDCDNGQWLFCQFGGEKRERGNGTMVHPADGSGDRLLLKGDVYELHSGDELRFANEWPGWFFIIPED